MKSQQLPPRQLASWAAKLLATCVVNYHSHRHLQAVVGSVQSSRRLEPDAPGRSGMVAARELEDGELEEGEITGDESEQVGPASLLSSACPCQAVQKARSF